MLEKLSFIFNAEKKRKAQLGKILTEISLKLKDQQTRLEEAIRRLKDRDKELFEKVVRAQVEGDDAKAKIYAQEIADIRKIIKVIYTAFLAIEKVRLKLDTVQELQGVSLVLYPVAKILGDLKDQIKGIAPEVAIALDSIISSVNGIAVETGTINDRGVIPAVVDEQARQILDEAQKMAEIKVKELLPDLPHPPIEQPRLQKVSIKKVTEKEILDYIMTNGGFLDIEHFSRSYGVDKQEVLKLLEVMKSKGLISVES
ncbi:cell division protein [Sulfolobus sp. A20]|uniref:cell division protein CdvB n=1 Tax=Sulfolobaceae TaxID=118883 RepID=UPI000845CC19|nr:MULTISPECIES: cell division protein CdvB [unclassified Sulfolobus]TRM73980.1 cell division protein [Sulfolobus sp. E5]TRM78266.1 cell division protein [Sulfolobus sp. A20-N-F8]TRM78336.1 cell division protein [Sulfolobus sp. B5]TRM82508.1 cell division protein [Sulfolobus sp. A20-N-F6]TRM88491.1 cell division protein [Sulfolobus sp. C3]TRM94450.1 cell division protein [Sulfolobus sp. A20-N-G8]TRM99276.1 cell division protein [Sulfolobus sp. E1]TRM99927.1 cell division protein [Sulfolobus